MPPMLLPWYAAIVSRTPIREVKEDWTEEEWFEMWEIIEATPKDRRPFDWAGTG